MTLQLGDTAPDFTAETTEGTISFHDWIGDGWALMFSHPKDFTPVCTTELGSVAGLKAEFDKRGCKIIGISVDGVSDHEAWSDDIKASQGHAVNYPLIGDPSLEVVKLYDMLAADAGDTSEGRTPADNATARSIAELVACPGLRPYTSTDLVGAEIGGVDLAAGLDPATAAAIKSSVMENVFRASDCATMVSMLNTSATGTPGSSSALASALV